MTFTQSIKTCLKKYFDFKGRASRSEYWYFALFLIILSVICSWSDILHILIALLFTIPQFSVAFRRLHDINLPGWIQFIPLLIFIVGMMLDFLLEIHDKSFGIFIFSLSVIGSIIILILCCIKGTQGPNKYGKETYVYTKNETN